MKNALIVILSWKNYKSDPQIPYGKKCVKLCKMIIIGFTHDHASVYVVHLHTHTQIHDFLSIYKLVAHATIEHW